MALGWGDAFAGAAPLHLIGVDEVGRGTLMGPVVAAAVQWHAPQWQPVAENDLLWGIKDSKQLSAAQRDALVPLIHQHAFWGVGWVSVAEITELNIHHASQLAAVRAIEALWQQRGAPCREADAVLMDGKHVLQGLPPALKQRAVVKGDTLSACIGAASILAKTARDAWVLEQAALWPQYGWAQNKGYATASHRLALQAHGPSPLHRPGFKGVAPRGL
jgi:ribonuclease HII